MATAHQRTAEAVRGGCGTVSASCVRACVTVTILRACTCGMQQLHRLRNLAPFYCTVPSKAAEYPYKVPFGHLRGWLFLHGEEPL